jgi:hypothetical protein
VVVAALPFEVRVRVRVVMVAAGAVRVLAMGVLVRGVPAGAAPGGLVDDPALAVA